MKGYLYIIGICVLLLACGEDRTHEYEERTARDHWMLETMRQEYLWGNELEDLAWKDYFAAPKEFMAKLTEQAPVTDSWSWCEIDTLPSDPRERGSFNHLNSYGLDVVLMTDPTGETSRQFARVMTVYENSPAARCGLQRGDFISMVDGSKLNASIIKNLVNGKTRSLTVERLTFNETDGTFEWSDPQTVEMEASEYVEDKAFPVCSVLSTASGKVGYLMCNRLTEGPEERSISLTTYRDDLIAKMASLAGDDYSAFVLDMRLCNDGTLDMACLLASYFVDESLRGEVFARTFYNEKNKALNSDILFNEQAIGNRLKVNSLFVITSSYTQGAPEWLIRGLRKAMGDDFVTVVGMETKGQIVMTGDIPSDFYVTLHPAVAYVADADGDYKYESGITPDIEVNEKAALYLYPYGNPQEVLLQMILNNE